MTKEAAMKTITLPALAQGEIYAGIILSEEGAPHHHLILLPGNNGPANWPAQIDWAKSICGELPTRREQSLLFANCNDHFEPAWYWSGEVFAAGAAWCQHFLGGLQDYRRKYIELRARAVRRVAI